MIFKFRPLKEWGSKDRKREEHQSDRGREDRAAIEESDDRA